MDVLRQFLCLCQNVKQWYRMAIGLLTVLVSKNGVFVSMNEPEISKEAG